MKLSFVLAAVVYTASVLAVPVNTEDVVAKRQVDTAVIRNGSQRLTARQAHQSPGPSYILTSKYINCPPAVPGTSLTSEAGAKWAQKTAPKNYVRCSYTNLSSSGGYNCMYDGDSGKLDQPTVQACATQLNVAPSTGVACHQGCPRQPNGLYFASGQIYFTKDRLDTLCLYSKEAFGKPSAKCMYDTKTGVAVSGTSDKCPGSIPLTDHCMTNLPQ